MDEAEIYAAVRAYQWAYHGELGSRFADVTIGKIMGDPFSVRAAWLGLCAAWRVYRDGERVMEAGDLGLVEAVVERKKRGRA